MDSVIKSDVTVLPFTVTIASEGTINVRLCSLDGGKAYDIVFIPVSSSVETDLPRAGSLLKKPLYWDLRSLLRRCIPRRSELDRIFVCRRRAAVLFGFFDI